jgi:hypothetical protein
VPIDRTALDDVLARMNEGRGRGERVLATDATPTRFSLAFPDRDLGPGRCIDEEFTEVQFLLKEATGEDTSIEDVKLDESAGAWRVTYGVVVW